jgi:hypothetical protein
MEAVSARATRRARTWLLPLAATLAIAGCGKKTTTSGSPSGAGPSGPAPIHVEGTPHTDAVVNALRGAGLKTEGFTVQVPVPYGAAFCEQGRVETIDTLVCEFRDTDSLTRGKAALLETWGKEGSQTALAYASKLTLIGVFDRARQDPNGKLISRVVETFRKL